MADLTPQQRQTLKTAVVADPVAGPARLAGDTATLRIWADGLSATDAWKLASSPQSSDEAATYTTYDSLVQGKRDSWRIFLMFTRDFTKAKIRNWVTDVWGAATGGSISESVLLSGVEKATNAQVVFGGTSPTTGTVTALKRNYTDRLTDADINWLVNN
jgi:hypothetical protein